MQRKLAAILAADVVGYSRLMRADETGTLAAMKALWSEVVQPSVRAHRGRVFKLMGDGMLAEFGSVVDAANAAEAIQMAANTRAEAIAEDRRIQLRIGINLGDVVVDGSDLYGDGVNIAARLQEVAPVGGIAVSAGTYEYLRGKTSVPFADAGERTLKNIDQPVRVWLWSGTSGTEPAATPTEAAIPGVAAGMSGRASQPSIAVLPFANLSSAPDAEFFADGMTEDVIDALSKFRWLVVIARGTMFTYKGKPVTDAQVARDLNVRYVLEGSVRQSGQRMRLSAQLTDTQAGGSIWSQRFDRQVDDIFAIQDEITNAIAAAIAPEIDRAERTRAADRPETGLDAWLFYQQGLAAYYKLTEEGLDEAVAAFRKAQQADPRFAPAWAMEAVSLTRLANNYRLHEKQHLNNAADLAARALALDPRDPQNWWASGRVLSIIGKQSEAVEHTEKAIELNPNYAMAWFGLGNALTRTETLDRALDAVDRAISLSPFDPFMPIFLFVRGNILHWLGQYQESIKSTERAMQLGKVPAWAYVHLAVTYSEVGDAENAKRVAAEMLQVFPTFRLSSVLSLGFRKDRAQILINGLRKLGVPEE